ncbi:hypothetical protein Ancab_013632 [Ancistrocladus abbreviatus]
MSESDAMPKDYPSRMWKYVLSATYWHGIVTPWTNMVDVDIEIYGSRFKIGGGELKKSNDGSAGCLHLFSGCRGQRVVHCATATFSGILVVLLNYDHQTIKGA